jgi:tRNA dimethylallyltransferase
MEVTNGRRIVRALEVVTLHGSMPGEMTTYDPHYDTTYVGVDRPDLAERIALRVDRMWEQGLVDEVRRLEGEGLRDGVTASRALGYGQVLVSWTSLGEAHARELDGRSRPAASPGGSARGSAATRGATGSTRPRTRCGRRSELLRQGRRLGPCASSRSRHGERLRRAARPRRPPA